jgi:hypothetical protein
MGVNIDPDGYTLSVDGLWHAVAPNETRAIAGLTAGDHTVRLFGLEPNCRLPVPAPSPLEIALGGGTDESWDLTIPVRVAGNGVTLTLEVTCHEVGTLVLTLHHQPVTVPPPICFG